MELSVTTDMFNYTYKPRMEEKFRLFKDHGFDYVHWCDDWDNERLYSREDMNLYRWLLDDRGLTCLDVHGTATQTARIDADDQAGHSAYVKLLKNRIEFCSKVGGDAVVVHPPRYHEPLLETRLSRAEAAVAEVAPLCGVLGVTLAFENCYRGDHDVLRWFMERFPEEVVSFCLDTGHANIHRNLDELKGFRERLTVTHIHDNRGDDDSHQPPGWGTVDWEKVNRLIDGIRKPPNLEVTHSRTHFKGSMEEFLTETRTAALNHLKTSSRKSK